MEKTITGIKNSTHLVKAALTASIIKTFEITPKKVPLTTLQNNKEGNDFQTAFAKSIFNQYKKNNDTIKELGAAKPVAELVLENLRTDYSDLISEAFVNDKGFAFIKLSPSFLLENTSNVLTHGVQAAIEEEK